MAQNLPNRRETRSNHAPGNVRLSNVVDGRCAPSTLHRARQRETVIKSVLLGNYGVGKTTLFRRIRGPVHGEESASGLSTWTNQSLDICSKTITTADSKTVQVTNVQALLWLPTVHVA